MKPKIKRLLSLILSLVLVLGLMPATPAMAADPLIEGTTGAGTESDPVIVDTFDELKAALQYNGDLYIRMDEITPNLIGLSGYEVALTPGEEYEADSPAINIPAGYEKHLTLNADVDCRAASKQGLMYSLIRNFGKLYINGTGALRVSFNAAYPNAIIFNASPGTLQIDGDVTLDATQKVFYTYGYAVYNQGGTSTLNGGTYICDDRYTVDHNVAAVYAYDGTVNISGGEYYSATTKENAFGLMIDDDDVEVTLTGGAYNGIKLPDGKALTDYYDTTKYEVTEEDGWTAIEKIAASNTISSLSVRVGGFTYGSDVSDLVVSVQTPGVTIKTFNIEEQSTPGSWSEAKGTFSKEKTYVLNVRLDVETGYDETGLTINDVKINGEKPDYFYNPWTGTPSAHMSIRYFLDTETPLYTGTGTESDPAVCTTFAAFKAAMEKSSVKYVKLVGGSYYYDTDTIPETEDGKIRNAVFCEGTKKVLILEGKTEFTGPATCNGLINVSVGNKLTITGDGYLAFSTAGHHEEDAVVNVNGTGAYLIVEGNAHLYGHSKTTGTHGRAIYAKTGTVIINGGYLTGRDDLGKYADLIFTGAVAITDDANFYFYGGNISTDRATETGKTCESALYLETTGTVKLCQGKVWEGGIVIRPNTSTIGAYFEDTKVYTKNGSAPREEAARNSLVSVLEGTINEIDLEYTKFVTAASFTVTAPLNGQAPDLDYHNVTAGNPNTYVDKITWYKGGTVNSPGTKMSSGDKFEAGETYIVDIYVKPDYNDGYVISSDCSVTINGVSCDTVFSRDQITGAGYYRVALTAEPVILTGWVQFTSAANPGKPIGMVLVDGTVKDVSSTALNYQWQIKVDGVWCSISTDRNFTPTTGHLGYQVRVIITADGYEGFIVSDTLTVAKVFNPASPAKAPVLEAKQAGTSYTTLRVYTEAGQDYVWRDSPEADPKAIDWSVNAFTKPDGAAYVDITGLTEGTTYYVYTRISETETTQAGVGVKYSSLLLQSPNYLQKVTLEGYTDYGDGNTIYIKKGETVTINVGKYPTAATTWSYFTFGDPSSSTYYFEVTSPMEQVQDTMPDSITLKGNNVGGGTLKAYYNSGMFDYGSWKVVVYDTLQAGQITFTDKPAYDDISLYVGDSYTPTAPASGILLPAEANTSDRFEYRWYLYEGTNATGVPYGTTTDNGYLSIDSETGKVTALSADCTGTHQPYVQLCLVDKGDQSKYQVVTEYKVTVLSNGEIPVDSVTVVPSVITLAPGISMTPTAVVSPTNHTETGSVVWSKVSGSDSITIDPATGKVTVSEYAMDGDTATIRATFGSKYGECVITVSIAKYGVTVNNGIAYVGAGTVITEAMEGTKVSLKANDAPSGKVFDKWVATSGEVIFANEANAETYFVMPGEDVAVEATYKEPDIDISTANVTATKPVKGNTPSNAATTDTQYTIANTVWDPADDPFVPDTVYSVLVTLEAKEGYQFTADTVFKINGSTANVVTRSAEEAKISLTFPATAAADHVHHLTLVPKQEATCTEPGHKAYYTCDGCDDWFEDATGSSVISDRNSVVIPATGHSYGSDNVCDICGHIKNTETGGGNTPDNGNSNNNNNNNNENAPDTGDSISPFMWAALLFACGFGIFGVNVYVKKKRVENAE